MFPYYFSPPTQENYLRVATRIVLLISVFSMLSTALHVEFITEKEKLFEISQCISPFFYSCNSFIFIILELLSLHSEILCHVKTGRIIDIMFSYLALYTRGLQKHRKCVLRKNDFYSIYLAFFEVSSYVYEFLHNY